MKEIELEEGFTKNDRYLVEEHLKHGTDDFLLAGVEDETFVVPYKYRKAGRNELDAIDRFKKDLLDFQQEYAQKYLDAGKPIRVEEYNGSVYIVPFEIKDKNISAERLALLASWTALEKYNTIIEAHRKLVQYGCSVGDVEFSNAAGEKYLSFVRQIEAKKEAKKKIAELQKVKQAAEHAKNKKSQKFNISCGEISEQINGLISETWDKVKKNYKTVGISTLIALSALGGNSLLKGCGEKVEHTEWDSVSLELYDDVERDTVYQDFMGRKHSDKYGNIARIMQLKPEISALLIAAEGYADETYEDGVGKLTIGSGTTFYLDERGQTKEVAEGERITNHGAMVQKWRFIEKHLLKHLGDKVGRSCSDGELMACIGAGFCWGEDAFSKSKFYESVCNGESLEQQSRKLTGFRKQKGLLKREYLLSACLLGKWNAKDLLNIPIYKIVNKGYLNSAIYRLDLHEIMPCQKDGDGKYKKDENGNDVPVIAQDDFASFYDNYAEVMTNMTKRAEKSLYPLKYVRDFMPEEMIDVINQRAQNGYDVAVFQSARGGR